MKKFILLLVLFLPLIIKAQYVGVGTTNPLAPLHIFSSGAEMLRLEGTNPYISIFDFKAGESGYISFRPISLPPGINTIDVGSAASSGLPVTISAETHIAAIFLPSGNVGINTTAPVEKLDVNGNINLTGVIKLNNSSGSAGQLLVSNGTSAPMWQNAPTPSLPNPTVGFDAILNANTPIGGGFTQLTTFYKFFDTQNNFNALTGVFTAPATGVYHFDATVVFASVPSSINASVAFEINGLTFGGCQKPVQLSSSASSSGLSHSVTIPLNTNSTVTCFASQDNGSTLNIRFGAANQNSSSFSGYRIY